MNVLSAIVLVLSSYYLVQIFQNVSFFRNFIESILKVSDISGTVVLMLPLGFSIGVIFNLLVHWIDFSRSFKDFSKPVLKVLFQVSSSSIIMGFVTYKCLSFFDNIFDINTLYGIFLQGFLSGIIGITSAVLVLHLLKSKELPEIWNTLHQKIWGARVVVPDAELN